MKKIEIAINKYISARNGLKELGIVRSDSSVAGNYGEWLAARKYRLKLVNNLVNKSFDATDRLGKKYQIKTRLVKDINSPTSFDFKKMGQFDYLVMVFLNKISFEPMFIKLVPKDFVARHVAKNASRLSFRWNKNMRSLLEKYK